MVIKEVKSAFRPWADLPEPLAEVVLELLPIVDYIHFGSVCRRWQSIQREHGLRYSPSPPPMPHPLPWLLPYDLSCPPHSSDPPKMISTSSCDDDDDDQVVVVESYSPLEKKSYRLPLPPGLPRSRPLYCLDSCRGWLLMTSYEPRGRPVPLGRPSYKRFLVTTEPFLYNPITRARIPLPPLSVTAGYGHRAALSAPPTADSCDILFVDLKGLFLHRLLRGGGGGGWTRVLDPWEEEAFSAIACGGKFYCHYSTVTVVIVDPRQLPEPRVELFDFGPRIRRIMGWDLGCSPVLFPGDHACLVEHDGEACFLLMRRLHKTYTIKEFRLFRADLSSGQWVRVETLGDRVLLVNHPCALSLVAADVGLKKNTIYYAQYGRDPGRHGTTCWWSAFDLDTGAWIDDVGTQQVSYLEVGRRSWHNHWFLPTLDSLPPSTVAGA